MQNYDPYLNTYNYPYNNSDPYNLVSNGDNQMPDSRYEDRGYGDPNMSYSNAYDNTGAQYSLKKEALLVMMRTYQDLPILYEDTEETAIPSLPILIL